MNRDSKQVLTEWLVISAQGGSEAAFTDLHDLWRADLRRLILSRIERPEVVDEVANDVWLAIARSLRQLEDPACFPRWAFRIVERRSTDWIRQRTRGRQREVAAASEAERLAPAAPVNPDATDETLRLREAIAQLSAEARELVQLYYELDRTVAEIAEIQALPVGTVKSRLFTVRETLRQKLERKLP